MFADIQEDTLNINPEEIVKKITKRTKALVPVDFAGHPVELDKIRTIARKYGLLVIEDAAHALGSEYKGKKVGSFSDMTMFSFHPVKAITTGEGGMIVTDRKDLYERLKKFRHHGIIRKPEKGAWYYEIEKPGYNYRITDLQCALGLSQLKRLDRFIRRRRELARRYGQLLKGTKELILPTEAKGSQSAWHLYPVQIAGGAAKRRKVFDALRRRGIGVQVHYMPLHLHPFYKKKFGYREGDFPKAEQYYERALTIPLFPKMTNREQEYVVDALKATLA